MKYPMLCNWVTMRKEDDKYFIYDHMCDLEDEIGRDLYYFMKKLNGKNDPYKISNYSHDEVDKILKELYDAEMIRKSRLYKERFGTFQFALFFPHITKNNRRICFFLNMLLLVSWLPVFISGMVSFVNSDIGITNFFVFILGFFIGSAIGCLLHEVLGHGVATLGAEGGKLYEIGVLMDNFFPGFYVFSDTDTIKNKFLRVQTHAAGLEINYLLVGIFLILTNAFTGVMKDLIFGMAFINLVTAFANSTLYGHLDGANIIGELFNEWDFVKKRCRIAKSRRLRRKCIDNNDYKTVVVSYIVYISRILLTISFIIIAMKVLWNVI